jgi:hypothetical protein
MISTITLKLKMSKMLLVIIYFVRVKISKLKIHMPKMKLKNILIIWHKKYLSHPTSPMTLVGPTKRFVQLTTHDGLPV